jgi:chaperonin cofactor prefoldin
MTDDTLTWDGIYNSLVEDKNNELYNNLTEHLDTLYTKIAELEKQNNDLISQLKEANSFYDMEIRLENL